jgi:hypothetical protein
MHRLATAPGKAIATEGEVCWPYAPHPWRGCLPLDLWCLTGGAWAPVLARLYTA